MATSHVLAVMMDRFGPPDVLRVGETPVPVPKSGQVLVAGV